jgi:hypothetical protein
LPDGKEWLYLPASEKMCLYESLKDGTLDLFDVAEMNDFLMMKADNEELARPKKD